MNRLIKNFLGFTILFFLLSDNLNAAYFKTGQIINNELKINKYFKIPLSEVEWLVKEQAKINIILKKDDLILTGAYGFPVPINNNTLIKVSSSEFGDVEAKFKQ